MGIEIQNSREDEDCLNSKFFSRLCALLIDRDLVLSLVPTSSSLSVSELHGKYYEIFHRSGNRNAASHLWASYILDRSTSFTTEEIYNLFGGFCPISGSPVRPSAWSKWGSIPFKKASNTGQSTTGSVSVLLAVCLRLARVC